MSTRVTRRIAAGATAFALAGISLIGIGASAASAIDTIPSDPTFGGSAYLLDGNTAVDITPGTSILNWSGLTTGTRAGAPLMIVAPGDTTSSVGVVPAGATEVWNFLAPQGQEGVKSAWNAYTSGGALVPTGQLLQNVTPLGLLNGGTGTPSGQAAVKAAGGDYSLGFAYTKNSGVTVVKTYFVHIHITAGTGDFTYQPVQVATVMTPTTTAITSSPASVLTGASFSLTATVAPAAATGTVQFKNGAANLGSPVPVTAGVATLTGATITTAGTASITAVYSGDSAYDVSTSPAASITVTAAPVTTTTTVAATSADGKANHPATLAATLTPAAAAGNVTFTGTVNGGPVVTLASNVAVSSGVASVVVTGLSAGTWSISAAFTGTAPFVSSASTTPASLVLTASSPVAQTDDQPVTVTIPDGTLTITTPYTAANPLDLGTASLDDATSTWFTPVTVFGSATDQSKAIQIVDRRAGAPGFTAQVASTPFQSGPQSFSAAHLGLVNLVAHQVAGNPLLASDVATQNIAANSPGLSASAQTFATYPAGKSNGTAWISGSLDLNHVESSVQPGLYTATLSFTAF